MHNYLLWVQCPTNQTINHDNRIDYLLWPTGEGLPCFELMQVLEIKRASSLTLSKPLATFIDTAYQKNSVDFTTDLKTIDELRLEALNVGFTSTHVQRIQRYLAQLMSLCKKFPMDQDNIKIPFGWYNSIGRDTTKPITCFDANFELASLLFNIGVIHSRIGNMEGTGTIDGLKKACASYMVAGGVFSYIRENYSNMLCLPTNTDLSEHALEALKQLMLAQAQECFILKGTMDKSIRDGMLAKLSQSAANLYDKTYDQAMALPNLFPQLWLYHMQTKALLHHAMANYRKSGEHLTNGEYGKEIGQLQIADQFIQQAKGLLETCQKNKETKAISPDLLNEVNTLNLVITKNLTRATKDNSIIYHETVPSRSLLPEIGFAIVAKTIPFNTDFFQNIDIIGRPLLENLPPLHLHYFFSAFFKQRDSKVKELLESLGQTRTHMDQVMRELNLPASLEAIEEPNAIPEAVLQKSKEIRNQGGADGLYSSMKTINALKKECVETLGQVRQLLDEEEEADKVMKTKYSEKWTIIPSSTANFPINTEYSTYNTTLESAMQADKLVNEKFEAHIANIIALCASEEELKAVIPAYCTGTNAPDKAERQVQLVKLRQLIDQQPGIIETLDNLAKEINATATQLDVPPVLQANCLEVEKKEDIFNDNLSKFQPFYKLIESVKQEADAHCDELKLLYKSFSNLAGKEAGLRDREAVLKTFDEAYRQYQIINGNIEEGIKFYVGFQHTLKELFTRTKEYRERRRTEQDSLLTQLDVVTGSMANLSVSGTGVSAAVPMGNGSMPINNSNWNPSIPIQYADGIDHINKSPASSQYHPPNVVANPLAQSAAHAYRVPSNVAGQYQNVGYSLQAQPPLPPRPHPAPYYQPNQPMYGSAPVPAPYNMVPSPQPSYQYYGLQPPMYNNILPQQSMPPFASPTSGYPNPNALPEYNQNTSAYPHVNPTQQQYYHQPRPPFYGQPPG